MTVNARNDQCLCLSKPPWNMVFLFAIWMIWQQRNKLIFQNCNPNPNLADHVIRQASDFFWCALDWKKTSSFVMKNIRWEKPRSGWRKLNTNGSSLGNLGLVGVGGMIRDESSNIPFLLYFSLCLCVSIFLSPFLFFHLEVRIKYRFQLTQLIKFLMVV